MRCRGLGPQFPTAGGLFCGRLDNAQRRVARFLKAARSRKVGSTGPNLRVTGQPTSARRWYAAALTCAGAPDRVQSRGCATGSNHRPQRTARIVAPASGLDARVLPLPPPTRSAPRIRQRSWHRFPILFQAGRGTSWVAAPCRGAVGPVGGTAGACCAWKCSNSSPFRTNRALLNTTMSEPTLCRMAATMGFR